MNKVIKYILVTGIIGISVYNSVYIESLSQKKKEEKSEIFNAQEFSQKFMSDKLKNIPAVKASSFIKGISENLKKYSIANGKSLGVSDYYNFIIEGNATVIELEDDNILIGINGTEKQKIRIATDFIFGNVIRDATGAANIGDFQNTMDFNNISIELNNIVREKIIPSFKEKVKAGSQLYFKGAVKINLKYPNFDSLRVFPLIIKINK